MFLSLSPLVWPLLLLGWFLKVWTVLWLIRLMPARFMTGRLTSLRTCAFDLTEPVWNTLRGWLARWLPADLAVAAAFWGLVYGLLTINMLLLFIVVTLGAR